MIHITTPRPRRELGLTADQLARRLRRNGHQVNRFDANCFLGFWLESRCRGRGQTKPLCAQRERHVARGVDRVPGRKEGCLRETSCSGFLTILTPLALHLSPRKGVKRAEPRDESSTPGYRAIVADSRRCPGCLETKPIEEFAVDRYKRSGRKSRCKRCDREKARAYYSANRERVLGRIKAYQAQRRDSRP